MSDFNPDTFLKQVLEDRNNDLGANGTFTFHLSIKFRDSPFISLIKINNLNEETARKMFDLFDEYNSMKQDSLLVKVNLRIQILDKKNQEIDINIIPNIHTRFEK